MSGLSKAAKIAARVGKGILFERVVTILTRFIDVMMVVLLLNGCSLFLVIIISVPVYYIFCAFVIIFYDYFSEKGSDLLGLNYLAELKEQEISKKEILKRAARWIVKRKVTIFLVGSIFELDPDVVAILLRKKGEKGFGVLFYSVVYSITIWSVIYWLGIKGYGYFRYFVE